MIKLIQKNFSQHQSVLYWCCVVLVLYTLGVGMASHYVNFLPPILYLNSLGTGIYLVTEMMIVLTACMCTGNHSRQLENQLVSIHYSYHQIFWSRLMTLFIDYATLALTGLVASLVAEKLVFKQKYLSLGSFHVMLISIGANFMLVFLLMSVTILLSSLIKSIKNTIVAGVGFQYLGSVLAAPVMILLYHHQWLKWNPFNCLFVQFQINKPINHAMTKLSMPDVLLSVSVYGVLYLSVAYLIYVVYDHQHSSLKG